MGANGGMLPQGLEAAAGAREKNAETSNLGVTHQNLLIEQQQKDMQLRGGIAQSLYADPSDENWQAQTANLKGHVSPQGQAQIDAAKTPEQRRQVASSMIAAALPPGEANAPHNFSATEGVTTPLQTLAGGNQAPGVTPPQSGKLPMSPQAQEQAKGAGTANIADLKAGNEKYNNANDVQEGLLNIQNNLDKMPPGGYWTSGKDAASRLALAKTVNTAMQVAFGTSVFDAQKLASAEAAQKGTVKLGFDLAKTLGSREAAMIVQQSIGVQPGIEMTPEGNHRIMTSLMVAAQRDKDEALFQHQYLKQNPDALPGDASMAFNQQHPPSEYVANTNRLLQIPKAKVDLLRSNPDKAGDFDAKYGDGMSRFLLAR
jgi:hypothetical protein